MKLHSTPIAALVALYSIGSAFAGGEGWSIDFEAAKKQAAAEKKDLLVDFTGSDWCGWCIKLNEEVFQKDEFKKGVKDKYVLVELDFPEDDSKLSEATKKQNGELQEKLGIDGFPTILLCDASGKPYAKTGYQEGGPEKYLTHLETLQKHKATRDEAFAGAAKAEGVEKAKKLVAALKALEALEIPEAAITSSYAEFVPQIKAADPKDETGFVKEIESKEKLVKFQMELNKFGETKDFEGALAYVNKVLKEDGFEGESKQQVTATKALIYLEIKKFDEAIKAIDEAKAIDPDSQIGQQMDGFKERLKQMKDSPEEEEGGEEPEDAKEAPAAEEKEK